MKVVFKEVTVEAVGRDGSDGVRVTFSVRNGWADDAKDGRVSKPSPLEMTFLRTRIGDLKLGQVFRLTLETTDE